MTCVRLFGMRDVEILPLSDAMVGSIFESKSISSDIFNEIFKTLDVLSKFQLALTSKTLRNLIISYGDNVNLLIFSMRLSDILIAAGFFYDTPKQNIKLIKDELHEVRLNFMQEWYNALSSKTPIRKKFLDRSFEILSIRWLSSKYKPFFSALGYSIHRENNSDLKKYKNSDALINLAQEYYENKEFEKSTFYYEVSAKDGHRNSQIFTAYHYEAGIGIYPDPIKAVHYYSLAAFQGCKAATLKLANKYMLGEGVAHNAAIATKLYLESAENGHLQSQFNTGICYFFGIGIEKNLGMAIKYFALAINQDLNDAKHWLNIALQELT